MMDSVYTAMTGLQSFSKGLDVISGNVTNINTVGYKATNLKYEDIHYNFDLQGERDQALYGAQVGGGVEADITSIQFSQGELRKTDNDTDVAINGRGFFILKKDDGYIYSRDGQFDFDANGDLVTRDGGYLVMGMSENGDLETINKNGLRTQPAQATTEVSFIGNISTAVKSTTVSSITVIDPLGTSHAFKAVFTADSTAARTWHISITDENGALVDSGGSIAFQDNGSPAVDANAFTFNYQADGAAAQIITFKFGDPNTFAQTTAFSSTSNLTVDKQNGHAAGSLLSTTFDDQGRLTATFSNQQTATGGQLALADFNNLQALIQLGQGLYKAQTERPQIGTAGKLSLGEISGGNLESSNIDLSTQFADMIVIQRGYQASSQVLTAANEMMQQLLEVGKK